jgi:reactive intermediate/imine deaminase
MPRQVISTDRAPASDHYAQAVRSGDLVFISGQIPLLPDRTPVNGSFEDQARQVFRNLQAVAEAAGGTLDDVVRVGVYLNDIGNWDRMNVVFHEFFAAPLPARSSIEGHMPGFEIEVDAIMRLG